MVKKERIISRDDTLLKWKSDGFQNRRCLVPTDGFSEWPRLREPYVVSMTDDRTFALAGIWHAQIDTATGEILESFEVITTSPNDIVKPLKDPMPVIVPPVEYDRWLTPSPIWEDVPVDLLRPYPAEEMQDYQVSSEVGNTRNNKPELLLKVADRQSSIFTSKE
jgi:putative SOS response-associated peptidase YedK